MNLPEPRILVANWRDQAACAGMPSEMFFPDRGSDSRSKAHMATVARQVCAVCPVRMPCLAIALATKERHGIWGGTVEKERRVMLRQIAAGVDVVEVVRSAVRHPTQPKPGTMAG